MDPLHCLWYDRPATYWNEALPLGNGRLGVMVFGGRDEEILALNEDTLWSGRPGRTSSDDYYAKLLHARELLAHGRRTEADRFITEHMLTRGRHQSYLPAGTLHLLFKTSAGADNGVPPSGGYRRWLDLSEAVAGVTADGCRRQTFVSAPANIMAWRVESSKAEGVSFSVSGDCPWPHEIRREGHDWILEAICPAHARKDEIRQQDDDGRQGLRYQIRARIGVEGGRVAPDGADGLRVDGADAATVWIAIRSNFAGWDEEPPERFPDEACRVDLDRAAAVSFDELRRGHIDEHRRSYDTCALSLPARIHDRTSTDRRILDYGTDPSPALAALAFHYGRYLLLASSRPGTEPANLQGIWNPHPSPPWSSGYTTNINLEMNYWSAPVAGLPDCAEPLFRFLKECARSGRAVARDYYHARGWCLHHNSDLWRNAAPAAGQARWGYWPMGGLWLCRHVHEAARFAGDDGPVRELFDVLRGAAAFALDLLVENEQGELVTRPATSPENAYRDPDTGEVVAVCADGTTMDLLLVREALEDFRDAAARIAPDDSLLAEIENALPRLRPASIGARGQLLEFDREYEEPEPGHRHTSHLYGVYPAALHTPERDAPLYRAARVSLENRGGRSTGWAMAWRLALWARFGDAAKTEALLREFFMPVDPGETRECYAGGGGTYPNLLAAHPPFQIDANLGVTAALAECLVQSHRTTPEGTRRIDLLPALPPSWREGRARGLGLRGGGILDLSWRDGTLAHARLRAPTPVEYELRAPNGFSRWVRVGPEGCVVEGAP